VPHGDGIPIVSYDPIDSWRYARVPQRRRQKQREIVPDRRYCSGAAAVVGECGRREYYRCGSESGKKNSRDT
jgi:hypothetical protein